LFFLTPAETSAEQTLQSSNNNLAAGRLKRDSMQSTDERAAEVNRIGGRIVRNDERKRSGGSIAVSCYHLTTRDSAYLLVWKSAKSSAMSSVSTISTLLYMISIGSNKCHCNAQEN